MIQQETRLSVGGATLFKGAIDRTTQEKMLVELREVVRAAPLFSPRIGRGKQMSVRMTSAGRYGWYSDARGGYRYEPKHPSGAAWPPIPRSVLRVWEALLPLSPAPDCCLLNFYGEGAKMGLHQDRDEADFSHPVLSISLGDEALFRIGSTTRGGPTQSAWLSSGDVLLLAGKARLAYHGIDRIKFGSSALLKEGGRLNLTLRVVD